VTTRHREVHGHPLGLGPGTAEKRSDDGRPLHYVVWRTGAELAGRLAEVDGQG
jgi:hypothetical protein